MAALLMRMPLAAALLMLKGQAMATQMVALTLAGDVSPSVSGLMRDSSGNYDLSLTAAALAFAAAAAQGGAGEAPAARG